MNVKENIKNLEAKLMQLNSLTNIKPEIENDSEKIDRMNDSYSNNNHSMHQSYLNTSLKNKNIKSEFNFRQKQSIEPKKMQQSMSFLKNENKEFNDEIEKYIEENERLKEFLREKSMKIETLNFRCEKVQTELAQKLNIINKLSLEVKELNSQSGLLVQQRDYLENLVEENKNTLLPEHQKLKSKYDICVLEIKSLENDNKILENKLKSYIEMNKNLKMENKDLSSKNSRMEIEKLEIKRDIEIIKSSIKINQDENKELHERNADVIVENERLKNQLSILKKKIKVLDGNAQLLNSYNMNNFDKINEVSIQIPDRELKNSMNERMNFKKSQNLKNKNSDDKLNFEDLNFFTKKLNNFSGSKKLN